MQIKLDLHIDIVNVIMTALAKLVITDLVEYVGGGNISADDEDVL